ncbi:MAG: hypothetical protein LBR29_08820 [Methylobacteriaceae bacterium]|jgi:hypothetical protein|nr:hypothetical protein [Methylobacteriaceae bacterium]
MIYFNANRGVRPEDAAGHGLGGSVKVAVGHFDAANGLPPVGTTAPLVALPAGARIVDARLATDLLDEGDGLIIDIGDAAAADRLFAGSDIGQLGGIEPLDNPGAAGWRYAESTVLGFTVQTGAETPSSGGALTLVVLYVID